MLSNGTLIISFWKFGACRIWQVGGEDETRQTVGSFQFHAHWEFRSVGRANNRRDARSRFR
jgi:hypothetical protein